MLMLKKSKIDNKSIKRDKGKSFRRKKYLDFKKSEIYLVVKATV